MPNMNMIQSLNSALDNVLENDPNVIIYGEDVGYFGGVSEPPTDSKRNTDLTESSTPRSPKAASRRPPSVWESTV